MVRSIMVMVLVLQVTVIMIASESEAISSQECYQKCINLCAGAAHQNPSCSAVCYRECNPPHVQTNIPIPTFPIPRHPIPPRSLYITLLYRT